MVGEIDEATLLAACEAGGRRVTRSQLKRWRGAGLLQRSRQEHLRGRRGSVSWYPEAAVEQALAVAELLGDGRRSNDWVLVQLWWQGMWVDEAVLRACLVKHFDAVSRDARELAATHDDPLDAADAAVRGMRWRDPTPISDAMLERLGGRRRGRRPLEDIMWFFFVLAFGGDYEPEPEADGSSALEKQAARATGVDRAKRGGGPTGEAWLANETTALGVVRELHWAGALDALDFAAPIRNATDHQLTRARDDARMFVGELAMIAAGVQLMLGADAAGLGSTTAMAAAVEDDPYILIYAVLVLRTALGDAPFDAIHALALDEGIRFGAIVELVTAVPAAGKLWDQARASHLENDVVTDVERVLQARPELRRAIEGQT